MNKFIIREATIDDINNGLLDVFIEGYRYHQNGRPDIFKNLTDEELKEDLIKNFDKYTTIVIIENNIIVGYLSYILKEKHRKKLYVNQLVIKENYRNKGLGKELMEESEKIALKNNCSSIELDSWIFNKNAIAMYEHIGFNKQRILFEKNLK